MKQKRPKITMPQVERAGELLLQAAATIGALSIEQQEVLRLATDGKLIYGIAWALEAAAEISPKVAKRLKARLPTGLIVLDLQNGDNIGWCAKASARSDKRVRSAQTAGTRGAL